jgi:hypothetical protein
VNVKVLNVAKRDLLKDLQRAPEYDWSVIFRKVYTDGLGTFGGDPVGVIIADQFFCAHPEDIELVEKMVQIASAAFCPFVCGATADFFSVRRWDDPNLFDPAVFREWPAPGGAHYLKDPIASTSRRCFRVGAPAHRPGAIPAQIVRILCGFILAISSRRELRGQ